VTAEGNIFHILVSLVSYLADWNTELMVSNL